MHKIITLKQACTCQLKTLSASTKSRLGLQRLSFHLPSTASFMRDLGAQVGFQVDTRISDWLQSGVLISLDQNQILIGWGPRIWSSKAHHFLPSFYFPDFFLQNKQPWFTHAEYRILSIEELAALLPKENLQPSLSWVPPNQEVFKSAFSDLQKQFKSQALIKAVPYVFEEVQQPMCQKRHLHTLQSALAYLAKHNTYVYGYWDAQEGMIGVTPETLFSWKDQQKLHTVACAGTWSAADYPNLNEVGSKEFHEHHIVIKGIIESLSPYGTVDISQSEFLKLNSLIHLNTSLTLNLTAPVSFDDIVHALHPTPALGAFPKKNGQLWLSQYQEIVNRGKYGAPVGCLFNQTHACCYVAIRNVQWNSQKMRIGAGCGVVAESQFENEWKEINMKLTAIKEMLSL